MSKLLRQGQVAVVVMFFFFSRTLGAVRIVIGNLCHHEPHSLNKTIRRNDWQLPAFLASPAPEELRLSADSAGSHAEVQPLRLLACPFPVMQNPFSTERKRIYFRWESSAGPDHSSARPAGNFADGIEFRQDRSSNFPQGRCWDKTSRSRKIPV